VPARLAALTFDDGSTLPERARAMLVAAQTGAALPAATRSPALARQRCDALIALLDEVPEEDQRRATGELTRIEGNAWLLRARLAAGEGDVDGAQRWLGRAAEVPGTIGRVARASLRAAEEPNAVPDAPGT
jgi:hypothetical protein